MADSATRLYVGHGEMARDQDGWYRSSGFWTRGRDSRAIATTFSAPVQPAWRTSGPPSNHPDDTPAAAPGPDYFFVPGHYAPVGDQLQWKRGFWARAQASWDWIPARWIRRAGRWDFRAGYWVADPAGSSADDANGGLPRGDNRDPSTPTQESTAPFRPPAPKTNATSSPGQKPASIGTVRRPSSCRRPECHFT